MRKLYCNQAGRLREAGGLDPYFHDNALLVSDTAMLHARRNYRALRRDYKVPAWKARSVLWYAAFYAYLDRDKTQFVSYQNEFPS